ncbi:MAG: aldehyde dehydrogenase [Planctomycetota bacterium]
MNDVLNYIEGEFVPARSGAWLDNVEPATGAKYGRIAASDASDVDHAVDAASRAFPMWSALSPAVRSDWLLAVADAIEAYLEPLAQAESRDNGKPITLARTVDIPRAASNFRFFAGAIRHDRMEAYQTSASVMNYALRQPRGVAGCISPWNLPLYLFTWKIAPALASGNTVVAKPSEMTPVTAAMLCALCRDVGLPPGVLNVVHGTGPSVGAPLVEHPNVPAISFTGGTTTGRTIAAAAAPMFKKLSLELGGKNPNIVFDDADLEKAVTTGVRAAFANQGQICLCGSRILVQRGVYDAYLAAFTERTRALKCGDPLDDATQQGALVSASHHDKVVSCIDRAREEGATVVVGGDRPDSLPERCANGFFLRPTVLSGLDMTCATNQEEIFGPVVTIQPFDDEQDAVRLANATPYGLAATIWTRDLNRAHRTAARVQSGVIWINCWLVRDLRTPFGGMKQSGVGREGGDEALRFFTEPKNICLHIDELD